MNQSETILVVDDSKQLRSAYRERLEQEGFIVREASNGELGYKDLMENHVDLVLLDVAMPKMNGIETLSLIRSNPKTVKIPVIILTVFDEHIAFHDKLLEAGANAYFVKEKTAIDDVIKEVHTQLKLSVTVGWRVHTT